MNVTQYSSRPLTTPQWALDAYRFPAMADIDQRDSAGVVGAVDEAGDYFLPAPDPTQRLPFALQAPDKRRLDLHAALTSTGIAPFPGDLDAIDVLSALDDTTVGTVLRWITSVQ